MLLDNCTVVTMDAERRILTRCRGRGPGQLDRRGRQVRRVRAALPGRARARPARLGRHAGPRRRPHPPAAGDAARLRRRGAAVGLDGGAHLHPRGRRTRPRTSASRRGSRSLEMLKAGTTAFLETLILGRHDARRRWPRRSRRPGCAPCSRAAITDGGGYLDESPLSTGLVRGAGGGDRRRARGRQAASTTPSGSASGSGRARRAASPRSCCASSSTLARAEGLGLVPALRDDRCASATGSASRYGCGQVEFLERVGMLGPDVVLVHCVRSRADDIALTRAAPGRASCTARPGPAKMGSGVTPVHLLLDAGINVALGTDAAAANNGADLHPRPQVGRLPAEAAHSRSDRRRPASRSSRWRRSAAHAPSGWPTSSGSIEVGQARRPDRRSGPTARTGRRSLPGRRTSCTRPRVPMSTP